MSDKVNIGHSPNHFIVLDAVSRGINNIDKISRVSKLSKAEVEQILNDLVFQRLILRNEKRRLLGRKKIELKITETGSSLLDSKKNELQENVHKMQQYYNSGDKSQLDSFMVSNRAWMPMMLFTGLMDILFFTSMMSLLGLALNPMESSFSDAGANVDNSGNAEDTTASTDTTSDSSGADSQDTGNDGSGFDGSGFDGSGFDGFDGGGFGF